jgi:hypothetical protein
MSMKLNIRYVTLSESEKTQISGCEEWHFLGVSQNGLGDSPMNRVCVSRVANMPNCGAGS